MDINEMNAASEPFGLDPGVDFANHVLLDVRRPAAYAKAGTRIAGARWRDPAAIASWAGEFPAGTRVLVYCVHGHEVSRGAALHLRAAGVEACFLRGGIEAWQAAGKALEPKPGRWVTRERPKIDRIACPWLIRRFVDPEAEFLYVPAAEVLAVAERLGAIPYDIPGVALSHVGELCSFDAFIARYRLTDPALQQLATIVRGADTSRLDLAPQSAGLYAVSLGLSRLFVDDQEMLRQGLVLYDALHAWCRDGQGEAHAWPPKMPAA